jgi:hypothetical protein
MEKSRDRTTAYVGSQSNIEPIKKLVPDAPEDTQQLFQQLKVRDVEIEWWFKEDPERIVELQTEPNKILPKLLERLGIEHRYPIEHVDLGPWKFKPQISQANVIGSTLLSEIWRFISTSQQNYKEFLNDYLKVIHQVSASTNASKKDTDAVIAAFNMVLGIYTIDFIGAMNAFGSGRFSKDIAAINP